MILVENGDQHGEIKVMIATAPEETALEEIVWMTGVAIATVNLVVNMVISTAIEGGIDTIRNIAMDPQINRLAMAIAKEHPV